MRGQWLYTAASILLVAVHFPAVAAERYAVIPRQEQASTAPAAASKTPENTPQSINGVSSSLSSSSLSLSASGNDVSTSSGAVTNGAAASSKTTNAPTSPSSTSFITAAPIPKGSLNITTANTTLIEGLPIQPEITPALSVAGALLLLTGTFYTLIGIKTKWLHIFLSPAYLSSLGVTILIIYVMNPPISNAIQGAYFVAACVTGLIAGGVAVLFQDITEGLGCFLGGFCISMWFLVLKSGGLITSTSGKIIFIALMTVGAFALYISHHTRPYGLIGCTSFAGATVIVIGVDCFSRAGLKEFWLYIWNLNGNLFPLHYSQPYPITRGIRVEIAAIILISLLGIMSQMKIWKIIKERREEREAEQKRKQDQRNISDEEQGRKIEEGAALDRVEWEDRYGHKDKTHVQERYLDSGVGTDEPSSTPKGSFSDAEGIEMHNLKGPAEGSKNERSTIHVAQGDDSEQLNSANGERTRGSVLNASGGTSTHGSPGEAFDATGSGPSSRAIRDLDPNLTLLPNVVHLPFKIPEVDAQNDDSRSSVAASLASEYLPDRLSKRLSGGSSLMRKLSKRPQRSYPAGGTDEEALVIPHASHDDDDQDSSVAATIDGVSNDAELEDALRSTRRASAAFDKRASQGSLDMLRAQIHESLDPSFIPDFSPQPSVVDAISTKLPASKTSSIASSRRSSRGSFEGRDKPQVLDAAGDPSAKTLSNSETAEQLASRAGLTGNLPEGASKVVMAYRTNEWAKHLDGAELPEIDPLNVSKRQSQELLQHPEKAAPVNVQALQQTPLDAEPAPAMSHADLPSAKRRSSTFMARNPFSKPKESQQQRPVPHPLTISKDMQRMPSQTSFTNAMSRSSSQTSLDSNKESYRPPLPKFRTSQISLSGSRGFRSSSTPIATSPLVESPIEEGIESSFPARFTPQPNHLMSQRDRIITSKPSSTSLLRTSYSNVALDQHPAYRTIEEDDDIPLAQRKSILQKQRSSSGPSGAATPLQRSGSTTPLYRSGSSTPGINGTATLQRVPSGTDNPQRLAAGPIPSQYPNHSVPIPHDTTTSQWRASLQPNTTAHLQHQEMEARRADMLREKRRASTTKQEQQFAQGIRASVLDKGMRRGSMLDLHKAAMRKMQQDVKL